MIEEIIEVRFKNIFKGIIFSCILVVMSILIYAIILTYSSVSDTTIPMVTTIITMFSILLSSMIFCGKIGNNGLVNGLIISGVYTILIYLLTNITRGTFIFNMQFLLTVFLIMIIGGIGGIIGVNSGRILSK